MLNMSTDADNLFMKQIIECSDMCLKENSINNVNVTELY